MGSFVLLAKLAGAAMNMAVAWRYGVSETVDVYNFLTTIIYWPIAIWFNVLSAVLIPTIAKARVGASQSLRRFQQEILGVNILVGIVLGLLLHALLPTLLTAPWSGLSGHALTEALHMSGPLALVLPMGLIASLASVWLLAFGYHRNTLCEGIPALTLTMTLLLPANLFHSPLVWGTVSGVGLQLLCLLWPLRRIEQLGPPLLGFQSPLWADFKYGVGLALLSNCIMSATTVIDQPFAAHLGPGSIATLSYASRLMSLCTSLTALAISRSTLPIFSELVSRNANAAIRSAGLYWSRLLLVGGAVVAGVMWVLAPYIVAILFQRGQFTAQNTVEIAAVFRYLLVQLPFYGCGLVFVAILTSQKRYVELLISSALALAIKLIGNSLLIPELGILGIPLSTALMYLATCLFMGLRANLTPTRNVG